MDEILYIEQLFGAVSVYITEQYGKRNNLSVLTKANANDFLTEVDINVQRALVGKIKGAFPGDLILAEESGLDTIPAHTHERCWIIEIGRAHV